MLADPAGQYHNLNKKAQRMFWLRSWLVLPCWHLCKHTNHYPINQIPFLKQGGYHHDRTDGDYCQSFIFWVCNHTATFSVVDTVSSATAGLSYSLTITGLTVTGLTTTGSTTTGLTTTGLTITGSGWTTIVGVAV